MSGIMPGPPWAQISCRLALGSLLLLGAGCTAGPFSTLDPAGPSASSVARVWWVMMSAGVAIVALAIVVGLAAMRPDARPHVSTRGWMLHGGLVIPAVLLVALLIYGIPAGKRLLSPEGEVYQVEVIGHQWRWEVRYPRPLAGIPQPSAPNVIHIPAGVPVEFLLTSEDVIHSFWIPRLGGKMDAIPGHVNTLRLQADQPGIYRGLCAEFCGTGHVLMMLEVHAHALPSPESDGATR